ncbi:MAG: hypothetical protein ACKO37_07915 [Vampirovibrionales bacterium]
MMTLDLYTTVRRSVTLGLVLLAGLVLGSQGLPVAKAESVISRLNTQLRQAQEVSIPDKLYIGQNASFIFRGTPGAKVTLFLSPSNEGFKTPQGIQLPIGSEYLMVEGTLATNGMLNLPTEIPNEEKLVGQTLFIAGISCTTSETCQAVSLRDASGRLTAQNARPLLKLAPKGKEGPSTMLMPMMPGMDSNTLRAIQNLNRAMDADTTEKRNSLDRGELDRNKLRDRNTFVNRGTGLIQAP